MQSNPQKLFVFTAPSGSGKTTVVRHLVETYDQLGFSVSATTRMRRAHEKHGVDYYFLSPETFQVWRSDGVFAEWEEVYENQFYGTPMFEIKRLWDQGKHVIFDIDVKGAMALKERYQEQATVVFIKVPSLEQLIARLKSRRTESEQSLQKRIERVKAELEYETSFDYVLINDKLEITLRNARDMMEKFIGQTADIQIR
jgi:guanylate kinase